MITLFGPCEISLGTFALMPDHMKREFAALANERSLEGMLSTRTIRDETGIAGHVLAEALHLRVKPYARIFSEARELDGEIMHPNARSRNDGGWRDEDR